MSEVKVQVPGSLPSLLPRTFEERPLRGPRAWKSSKRRLFVVACLAVGDFVSGAVAIAAVIVLAEWVAGEGGNSRGLSDHLPVMLLMLVAIYCWLGLYRSGTKSLLERFRLRAMAALLVVFGETLLLIREGPSLGLLIVPFAGGSTLILGSWVEHFIVAWLIRRGAWGAPTAILSSYERGQAFARLVMAHPDWGLHPVYFVDDGSTDANEPPRAGESAPILPLLGSINRSRAEERAEILVVTDPNVLSRDHSVLHSLGFKNILLINQVGQIPTFGVQIRHFDCCVALELGRSRYPNLLLKRTIDLAVAIPAAILLGPVIALLALTIRIVDPGSSLYGQWRTGCRGKPIYVLKLRTMYQDADRRLSGVLARDSAAREEWQRFFKLSNDPRILPHIGGFLRRTSLDELPQLWNVIRGDMSLVGPRPFPDYHMNAFDPEFQTLRVSVPPGLTGLWQITSRSNGDLEVQRSQDCFYIRTRSLWLDLYILLATVPAMIGAQGAK
jgi:lipopolysaccharide/colanic/teichoic acid biosynthesis glycosyltransferase